MQNCILQSLFAPKRRLLLLIVLCFITSVFSNAQNLLSTNNNPGFEGVGGFQANGYTDISPGTSGSSSNGNYALTGNSGPMNTSSFNTVAPHSGAKMMVIDANNQIFWQQNPNIKLQGGVTYTFSYWVININKNGTSNSAFPNPVIVFNAADQCSCTPVLKSGSATVNNSTWQKVVYEFTPSGTGDKWVRIELSTPGATPNGNDFAIDDISLYAPPAPLTISTSLTNPSCPTGNDGVIVAYPNGGVAPFTFTLSGTATATNTTGIFQNLAGGSYTVSVTDSNSPASTVSTPANLTAPPDITLNASPTGCLLSGASVTLTAANGGTTYGWSASPGGTIAGTSNSITVNPTVTTTYTVTSTTIPPSVGNLIGNPGFENGTSGFYSDYGYSLTNTSGTQFAYGIVTNPSAWYNKFTTCGDKTTGSGKMLVADGATVANSVIWSQTVPVETSKTYNFSFWTQNIGDGSVATFQVLINGTPITISPVSATNVVTAGTPATTTCNWTKITGTWNSSVSTLATIKIIDTNISGGGNDFAIDDLSFSTTSSKSCPLTKSIDVTIGGTAPVIGFSYTSPVCKSGTNPTPTGVSGFVTGGTYSSTSGLSINSTTGEIDLAASSVGTYTVTYAVAANAAMCRLAGSSTATITINALPTITGTLNVCVGSTTALTGSGTADATTPWVSGTTAVATISSAGVVTGVSAGTSTITYKNSNGCTKTATVTVNALPTITGTLNVCVGSTTALTGSGTADATTPWVSGTTAVATISSAGVVTGVSAGTSTITYKNSNGCIKTATVTVNALPTITGTLNVCVGSTTALTGSGTADATTPWVSGTTAVATISSAGVVTGVSAGTSTITYKNSSGCTKTATVTVSALPTITGTLNVCVGSTTALTGSGTADATTPWVSGTTAVATISSAGVVTGVSAGTSTITYKNSNGCTKTATVTVNALPTITGTLNVCVGSTTALTGSGTADATTPWVSGTTAVATISNAGVVTGVSAGTSTITYKNSSGCTKTATVTVNTLPTITGTLNVCVGSTTALTGSGTADATTPWVSGTTAVATISSAGVVTGVSAGTSTITYKNSNGCTKTAIVTVNALPTLTISCGISTSTSVVFNWNAISGATSYNYSYSVASGTPVTGTVSGTTLTINGLAPGQNVAITLTSVGNSCVTTGSGNCVSSNCPTPIVDPVSDITTVCTNGTVIVPSFTSASSGVTFNWASNNTTIGMAANGNGNIPSFTALNSTAVIQTATISVTAFDGTCTGPASTFKISINPLPTATISGTTSVCSGTGTNIAFSGTPNATVTYTVNGGSNQTIGLDGTGAAVFPTGNLTVNTNFSLVSILNPITSCSQTQTGTASVTINSLPTATISGTTSICSGTGTNITFSGTPNAMVTYTVNSGSNQTITLDSSGSAVLPTGNLTVNTNFSLVSVLNSSTGCSQAQTGTASVTINSLPTATISGTTSICSGTGTNIAFSGTPNATVTYTVNSGSNQTITLDSSGSAVLPTGNLTVNANFSLVSVLNSSTGCSQVQTGTASVTINSLPTITISGTTSVCSGTGTNITFSGTPNASVTYTVNSGSNQTVVLDAAGSAILPTGNLTVNMVYSLVSVLNPSTGCSQVQTGTASVTINSLPTVTISGTTSICSGTGTNITFSGTPNATVTYTVNSGSNQTITLDSSGSAVLPTGNLTVNTNFSLVSVLNSSTGCSQVQTGTASVTINSLPTVTISGTTSVCSGTGTNITFSGTPNASVTYTVNSGSNQTVVLDAAGSAILPTGNLTVNMVYSLVSVLNPSTGCSQVQTGTASVTINSLPTVTISGTTSICSGTGTNITFSGTPNVTVTYTVSGGPNQTIGLDGTGSAILATGNLTVNTNYSLVSVLNPVTNCSQAQTGTASVTINSLPIAGISGSASVCSGTGTNIAFSGTPNAVITFTINNGSNQTITLNSSGSAVLPTGNLIVNTDYSLVSVLNPATGCSQVQTGTASVTINPLPTAGISGTASICSGTGTNITFSGTPNVTVTYTLNGGSNQTIGLDAAGLAVLSTGNLTVNADYSLVSVLNPSTGCSQAQTGTALVTINSLPIVAISGTASVCSGTGTDITFSGTPNTIVTYTVNGGLNQTIGLDVSGSVVMPTGNLTVNTDYSLVNVLNPATNCSQVQSGNAVVTVIPLPTSILTSAAVTSNQILCQGTVLTPITYSVGGSATGATVTGLPTGVTGSFVGGIFTISGVPTVDGTFNYVVTTTGGCSPAVTLEGIIIVKPLSTLVLSTPTTTAVQTICLNDAVASISYVVGGSATNAVASGLPAGVTGNLVSNVFTINGTPTVSGTYNYTVITLGGCDPAVTLNGVITVNALPVADFTGATSVCSGDVTALVLSSTIPGTAFSWNAVQNNVTGASSGRGSVINQGLTATGNTMGQVVYNVTPMMGSCVGLPKMITVDVSPVPNVIENTVKKTLCSGETTSIDLSSAIVGTTFSWTVNANGVTGALAGTGSKITQLLVNAGFVIGTVDYTITPSINGCAGTPVTVTINVNPLPEVLGTPPGTICSGGITNITLSPTIVGTVFDWTVVQNAVTGAAAGTGNSIEQVLETVGSFQGNAVYTITPSLNGCVGTPLDIVENVNPSPKPTLNDGVICVEKETGVAFKTYSLDSGLDESEYDFQWYLNSSPISGAISNVFEANLSGNYTVKAVNNVTGCEATSEIAKVDASFPGLAITTNQTLAFSDNARVEVTVTGGNAAYEYQLDDGSFQSSNVFEYMKPGPHSIAIGDVNGCTNLSQDFYVVGYPKFFSPNGDGHNDTWNVVGLEGQPKSNIFIFDRYGKLIKQISPSGEGWDGNYIGQPLPATDYWFTVEFLEQSENKIFKAHFSLIR